MVYSLSLCTNSAVHLSDSLLKYFQKASVKYIILIVNHQNITFETRKMLRSALQYSLQGKMSISDMLLYPGNPSYFHLPNIIFGVSSMIIEIERSLSTIPMT